MAVIRKISAIGPLLHEDGGEPIQSRGVEIGTNEEDFGGIIREFARLRQEVNATLIEEFGKLSTVLSAEMVRSPSAHYM